MIHEIPIWLLLLLAGGGAGWSLGWLLSSYWCSCSAKWRGSRKSHFFQYTNLLLFHIVACWLLLSCMGTWDMRTASIFWIELEDDVCNRSNRPFDVRLPIFEECQRSKEFEDSVRVLYSIPILCSGLAIQKNFSVQHAPQNFFPQGGKKKTIMNECIFGVLQ